MKKFFPKIKAVIGDHPDAMYMESYNPDVVNYKITNTPIFIITS